MLWRIGDGRLDKWLTSGHALLAADGNNDVNSPELLDGDLFLDDNRTISILLLDFGFIFNISNI